MWTGTYNRVDFFPQVESSISVFFFRRGAILQPWESEIDLAIERAQRARSIIVNVTRQVYALLIAIITIERCVMRRRNSWRGTRDSRRRKSPALIGRRARESRSADFPCRWRNSHEREWNCKKLQRAPWVSFEHPVCAVGGTIGRTRPRETRKRKRALGHVYRRHAHAREPFNPLALRKKVILFLRNDCARDIVL